MITETQRIARRDWIGSSDMAAVLGVSQWRTPRDVWLEKTGRLEPQAPNLAMRIGTLLEPVILELSEEELGPLMTDPERLEFTLPDHGLMSHPDALDEPGDPLDAKWSGIGSGFGEDGTDDIPDDACVQMHVHMLCTGRKLCHVPTLVGRNKFAIYHVELRDSLANMILEFAKDFRACVAADVPPPDLRVSEGVAKRVRREPASIVSVPDEIVAAWRQANQERLAAEKAEDYHKSLVLGHLLDNEGGTCSAGMVTYFNQVQHRKAQEARTIEFRTLRFKAAK